MVWNLTALQGNDTSLITLVQVTNDAVNGLLVGGLLIGVFMIQILMLNEKVKATLSESLAVSAWLCFIYSIFFSMASLLNFLFVVGFLTLSAFATLMLYLQKK